MSEKQYKVTIEGQTLDLPAEIASDDNKLKAALQPFFPGAANAKFMRSEVDGVETVNVVKQAGTKGRFTLDIAPTPGPSPERRGEKALDRLHDCEQSRNPVIDLYEEMRDVDPRSLTTDELLALNSRIDAVMEEGLEQEHLMVRAVGRLKSVRAVPANVTPDGF